MDAKPTLLEFNLVLGLTSYSLSPNPMFDVPLREVSCSAMLDSRTQANNSRNTYVQAHKQIPRSEFSNSGTTKVHLEAIQVII